jgi:hypothetical protein
LCSEDGDGVCELSEAFGQPAAIAERLERVAATLLARAAELKRPPIPSARGRGISACRPLDVISAQDFVCPTLVLVTTS